MNQFFLILTLMSFFMACSQSQSIEGAICGTESELQNSTSGELNTSDSSFSLTYIPSHALLPDTTYYTYELKDDCTLSRTVKKTGTDCNRADSVSLNADDFSSLNDLIDTDQLLTQEDIIDNECIGGTADQYIFTSDNETNTFNINDGCGLGIEPDDIRTLREALDETITQSFTDDLSC